MKMIKRFVKNGLQVEAMQLTAENRASVVAWLKGTRTIGGHIIGDTFIEVTLGYDEAYISAKLGDWITRNEINQHLVIKPEEFPEYCKSNEDGDLRQTFTAKSIVEVLNKLLDVDPACIRELIDKRSPCRGNLNDYPHVFVDDSEKPTLGWLGILNGLFDAKYGPIVAHYDDNGVLFKFSLASEQ